MNRKQKNILIRILLTAALMLILHPLPVEGWARLLLTLIPYLLFCWDILRKAILGILHRELFDENFLMSIATIGALVLDNMRKASKSCFSIKLESCFRVTPSERAAAALLP